MNRLAVNVDIDDLRLYHGIHGLDPRDASDAAWELGVPRFLDLFSLLGLKATFFVVASDLDRQIPRTIASRIVAAGHELASHSWSHPYNLIQLDRDNIEAEISRAEVPIAELRGAPVRGFRAPGYNVSDTVLEILRDRGYTYDSSLFPSPPYYLARTTVIKAMSLMGKRSSSIVGDWRASFGPTMPSRNEFGLWEYPISVIPGIRWPLIGTFVTMMGQFGFNAVLPLLDKMPFINLEFHAVDLLDKSDPVHRALVRRQGDLRVNFRQKIDLFKQLLKAASHRRQNETLEIFSQQ